MANFTVNNQAEFNSALSSAVGGDTITLNAGAADGSSYGILDIGSASPASELVITTDAANRAVCQKFLGNGCGNIRLENIRIQSNTSVQSGGGNTNSTGTAVFIQNYGTGMVLSGLQVYGYNTGTQASPSYPVCGISLLNGTGGRVESCEVQQFTNLSHFQNYAGLVVFGNWFHDWSGGDAVIFQYGGALDFDENYATDHRYIAGSHADGIQWRFQFGNLAGPFRVRKNFFRSGADGWFQTFLAQNDPDDVLFEDNVIYNGHVYGIRMAGTSVQAITRRNTVLHNSTYDAAADPTTSASEVPVIGYYGCNGYLEASDNIAPLTITQGTPALNVNSNNQSILRADYDDYFVNALLNENATFDDLRLDPNKTLGAQAISEGKGSIYSRQSGTYPAGYTLAQGGTPPSGPASIPNLVNFDITVG